MSKLRIASKNFICEKCNQMINNGEEYFDWWNLSKDGFYYHKRFHKGCVDTTKNIKNVTVKTTTSEISIFERVQKLIEKENGCLIAVNYPKNEKCYVCGIGYNHNDEKVFLCITWEDKKLYYENVEYFRKNYIDENGKYF